MGIFNKIFGLTPNANEQPDIMFGRYNDSYKSDEKYKSWDKALDHFEKQAYFESYQQFLEYLKDEKIKNVKYEFDESQKKIKFILYQGSKTVEGVIHEDRITAEAKIARSENNELGILRKLIEMNFNLKYSRYALDRDENITMVFNSYFLDCSPYKLYYALKELSTSADKQDDLFINQFKGLEAVNMGHIRHIEDEEIQIKFNFLKKKIGFVLDQFENGKLDKTTYPGGKTFQLLDVVYKLDYLLKPEGLIMESFENIHKGFFKNDDKTVHKKNSNIVKELEKIQKVTPSEFEKEIYEVLSTFGVTVPTSYEQYKTFAQAELANMDWYVDNKYTSVGRSIPSYIVGYSLFNYALPRPLTKLFHLFYYITECAFFNELGFTCQFLDEKGKLIEKEIKRSLASIRQEFKASFPNFNPRKYSLNYQSIESFSKSFIVMTLNLNLDKESI
jgi:hypothetical protein